MYTDSDQAVPQTLFIRCENSLYTEGWVIVSKNKNQKGITRIKIQN